MDGQDQSKLPEETRSKSKDSGSQNAVSAMGCGPSQAVIIQSSANRNSRLYPTVFMVGEESFQMLRGLGELKFYHLGQLNRTDETEDMHRDFARQLENPVKYGRSRYENMQGEDFETQSKQTSTGNLRREGFTSTRICQVKETITERYSNEMPDGKTSSGLNGRTSTECLNDVPSKSFTEHHHLNIAHGTDPKLRNEYIAMGAMLANPTGAKFQKNLTNLKISSPKKTCDVKQSAIEKQFSSDRKQKAKTFFGRNRVEPNQCLTNSVTDDGDCAMHATRDVEKFTGTPATKAIQLTFEVATQETSSNISSNTSR